MSDFSGPVSDISHENLISVHASKPKWVYSQIEHKLHPSDAPFILPGFKYLTWGLFEFHLHFEVKDI